MAKIWCGKTGSLIQGHVLDCARAPLERKIREYDDQLYVKWNPKKLRGWGCWELRRRPNQKTPVESVLFQGNTYTRIEYRETNIENHILDIPFLNYSIIERIKKMDTWEHTTGLGFAHDYEYLEAKHHERIDEKAAEERAYNLKQMKRELKDLKEMVLSGHSPARIADYWNSKS